MANESFKTLLNKIVERFPSRTALAKAVNITASRLSRALNTGDFPFNVENCLRLAKVSGESPSEVLRAAENGDIAELIESLYGPERPVTDPAVRDLLEHWPTLSEDDKEYVRLNIALVLRARRTEKNAQHADAPQRKRRREDHEREATHKQEVALKQRGRSGSSK